jgi:serine/threonine protein kinase
MAKGTLETVKDIDRKTKILYATQLCSGIASLHERHIIHTDIKPDNILVFSDGIRIADFGSALFYSPRELRLRERNVGAVAYRAPENVFDTAGVFGPEIDSWSLGVVLWELFAGRMLLKMDSEIDNKTLYEVELLCGCSLLSLFESPMTSWPEIIHGSRWHLYESYFAKLDPERETEIFSMINHSPIYFHIRNLLTWNPRKRPVGSALRIDKTTRNDYPVLSVYPPVTNDLHRKNTLTHLVDIAVMWEYSTTTILRAITYYDLYYACLAETHEKIEDLGDEFSRRTGAVALSIAADTSEADSRSYRQLCTAFNLSLKNHNALSMHREVFLKIVDYDIICSTALYEAEEIMKDTPLPTHFHSAVISSYINGECFLHNTRDLAFKILEKYKITSVECSPRDPNEKIAQDILNEASLLDFVGDSPAR